MNDGIVPGARVPVHILRNSPCTLHCLDAVPEVLEAVGTVDRIEAGPDHPVVVIFDFKGDELVVMGAEPPGPGPAGGGRVDSA
jgi:hypothetical protein